MGMKGIGSAFIVGGALIASFLSPMNSPENSPIKGAYEDLGAEALRKLYVEDMPLVVIIDSEGNNLYELGREEYLKKQK